MDSKIIIIILLVITLSVLATAVVMYLTFSDSIQSDNEQKQLEKRLRNYEALANSQCSPGEGLIRHNGERWCEEAFYGYAIEAKQDCAYAQTPVYLAWCEYSGFR
jgi:hypothetical protein